MKKVTLFFSLFFLLFSPVLVFAHAFGQNYVLPLPLWLYLYGGGAAVVVSFIIVGFFVSGIKSSTAYPTVKIPAANFLKNIWFKRSIQTLSLLFFCIAIVAGFIGSQAPTENFAPLLFWILLLLGITYSSAFFGDIWQLINPFRIIAHTFIKLTRRENEVFFDYPAVLGYIPGLIVYFFIIWLELLSNGYAVVPVNLSLILVLFLIFSLFGTILFGEKAWFAYGDFFTIFFGSFAHISPFEYREGHFYLRPPFIGLTRLTVSKTSLLLFIFFMLSSTAFDGFRSTTAWMTFYLHILYPLAQMIGYSTVSTLALLFSPLFFLSLFFIALVCMKLLVKTEKSLKELAFAFAPSLIPIALAYNIAHYYTLLIVQGQAFFSMISDPFNLGWNLFGTAQQVINVGVIGASFIWNSQVATIIIGHIAAVYLAHLAALQLFPSQKKTIVSQIPMLLLMIAYTMVGLWILSQPLTLGG